MVNAKDTLNEYNKTKGELACSTSNLAKGKKEIFGLSKDQKQVFIDMLKGGLEKDQINKIYKQTYGTKLQDRKELTQKYKEENKDLVAKYKELNKQKKLDEATFQELTQKAKELGFDNEEQLREMIMGKKEQKETKESPHKTIEKERKTLAIAELDRLGMKTDENVEKINAVQFLDDKILIGNTPWAYENMTGDKGTFKKETNRRYYNFSERKIEAKNQGIVLPEKKDFENSLKALPGTYSESNWYKGGNILSIILGESMSGYCDSDGTLSSDGKYGYLGSVSEYNEDNARYFCFGKDEGKLHGGHKDNRFVCRPLVKNS